MACSIARLRPPPAARLGPIAARIVAVTLARFYAPDLDPTQVEVTLSPDESHHLVRVMRLVRGDHVAVFDGRGLEFRGRVHRADRQSATVAILDPVDATPEPAVPITLVQAVLKGDKMDAIVRDATMAGVARMTPIVTEHSLVSLSTIHKARAIDRWQRIAVASAKQCGRTRLPIITPPVRFADWINQAFDGVRLLLVEPSAVSGRVPNLARLRHEDAPRAAACLVGPEGGWAGLERDSAIAAGCRPFSLGSLTLRADAVPVVAVSLLRFAFDDL